MRWRLAIGILAAFAACRSFDASEPTPATALDGGSTDAGGLSDASTSTGAGTALRCDQRNDLLLCEDFDNPAMPGWTNEPVGGGTATITSHEGHASTLRGAVPIGVESYGLFAKSVEWSVDKIYARFRMYLDEGLPGENVYVPLSFENVELEIVNNKPVVNQFKDPRLSAEGNTAFPFGQWACVEWMVAPRETTVWLNGQLLIDRPLDGTDGPLTVPSTHIEVGLTRDGASTAAAAVYLDDLAIAAHPIGCQ